MYCPAVCHLDLTFSPITALFYAALPLLFEGVAVARWWAIRDIDRHFDNLNWPRNLNDPLRSLNEHPFDDDLRCWFGLTACA